MKPRTFMLIAGEASGDVLGSELVQALRKEFSLVPANHTMDYQPTETSLEPRFFGAGGPRMAAAGVELNLDLTAHAVIGISDVLRQAVKIGRAFRELYRLAIERQPDAIICVDYPGFNLRFAHAVRHYARTHQGWFHDWTPKLIQYNSPQVWASREGRAYRLARDYDLLLSIFPFEKDWYAKRVPGFKVEFIGHPILDRFGAQGTSSPTLNAPNAPAILLLPGSRRAELERHLPVMLDAFALIKYQVPGVRGQIILPAEDLVRMAGDRCQAAGVEIQSGSVEEALRGADLAIAKTGTVTVECAFFGVPTVALYKTSRFTYCLARTIVKVQYLAMPNLLANEEVFPELIQSAATPENVAQAALQLLQDRGRREKVKTRLREIVAGLGSPGASRRAAQAVIRLLISP